METIPTFCVNMGESRQRWETMMRRFAQVDLRVQRWEAATPSSLGSYPYAHYLSAGERGCAKSHCDIWQYQVKNKIPFIMVFEDDAVLRKDFKEVLEPKLITLEKEDPDWDLILLNASEADGLHCWHRAMNQCMTAGYLLSLRGAEELVRLAQQTLYASDWMTQILQRRNHSYTYFPWLVIQELNESVIKKTKNDADWEKVKRLLGAAQFSLENYNF
jgi:GR25 family glycosyltransferase involved in LPS biosynthesis